MGKVQRVGVSFEPDLLEKFDKLIHEKGYTNRSEAIRDLIRESIINNKINTEKGDVIGTITFLWNHHEGNVTNRLLHLQHDHFADISFTTHVHIDKELCLEIIVVRGNNKDINLLSDRIKSIKGVKHCELVITKVT